MVPATAPASPPLPDTNLALDNRHWAHPTLDLTLVPTPGGAPLPCLVPLTRASVLLVPGARLPPSPPPVTTGAVSAASPTTARMTSGDRATGSVGTAPVGIALDVRTCDSIPSVSIPTAPRRPLTSITSMAMARSDPVAMTLRTCVRCVTAIIRKELLGTSRAAGTPPNRTADQLGWARRGWGTHGAPDAYRAVGFGFSLSVRVPISRCEARRLTHRELQGGARCPGPHPRTTTSAAGATHRRSSGPTSRPRAAPPECRPCPTTSASTSGAGPWWKRAWKHPAATQWHLDDRSVVARRAELEDLWGRDEGHPAPGRDAPGRDTPRTQREGPQGAALADRRRRRHRRRAGPTAQTSWPRSGGNGWPADAAAAARRRHQLGLANPSAGWPSGGSSSSPTGPATSRATPLELDDDEAQYLLDCYRLHPKGHDREGRRVVTRAVYSRAKGSRKSELAGAIDLFEALGPCRFDRWKGSDPAGREITYPFVRWPGH